jgi:hypothetical protein
MNWLPINLQELLSDLEANEKRMDVKAAELWSKISIAPEKWEEVEMGEEGEGFYVVAIMEDWIIWYNDIEDGYNLSKFKEHGHIQGYQVEQYELVHIVNRIIAFGLPK